MAAIALSRPLRRLATTVEVPKLVLVPVALVVVCLPLLKPSGPGNTSPVDVPIVIAIGATILWTGWAGVQLRLAYGLGMGLMMLGGAIGALSGAFPLSGLLGLIQDLFLLTFCATIVNVCRTPAAIGLVLRTWAWSAVAWALILVASYAAGISAISGVNDRTGVRASLTFGDANYAANFFFMSIMVLAASRTPRPIWLRIPAYLIILAALGLTGSNGGILSLTVAMVILVSGRFWRRYGPMPGLGAASALVLLLLTFTVFLPLSAIENWAVGTGIPILKDGLGRSGSTLGDRLTLAKEALALYGQAGPFGLGPSTTILYLKAQQAAYVHEAHDDYAAALVERGLIGSVGLIVLVGSAVARVRMAVAGPLTEGFRAAVPDVLPLAAALAGLALAATYYQVLHFRHAWVLLSVVAAIQLWGRRPEGDPTMVAAR